VMYVHQSVGTITNPLTNPPSPTYVALQGQEAEDDGVGPSRELAHFHLLESDH
jgi:hypothetical protein